MQLPKFSISSKHKKIFFWTLAIFISLISVLAIIAYNKREFLLQQIIAKVITKADKDFGVAIKINDAHFNGFSSVQFKNISIVPKDRDSLLQINQLSVGVKVLPLLIGRVKLSEINLSQGELNIVFRDSVSNLDFILKRKKKNNDKNKSKLDLSDLANNLLNQFLYKIPDNMKVKNFMVKLNDNDTAKVKLYTTTATIEDGKLQSSILVNDNYATWHLNGNVKPNKQQLDVALYADNKPVELPYLNHKIKGKLSFDTVRTQMKDAGYENGYFKISGSWAVKNLHINHFRIATKDVILPDAKIDADMLFGNNYVAIDSTSTIYLKRASIHPYLKYTLKPHKIYEMKLRIPEQDAQELVNAFPICLFESLEGMQVAGKLHYNLNFQLDSSLPDSVIFNSQLSPVNFRIIKWGKTNLQKINSDFIYTPYEYGKPMRDILIGEKNPNFTALEFISPNFKNALLTSEDPSFFTHKGFVEESIRKSIAVNFKTKKFKRGGSTISMQLVKNVFLSRKKTLSRKIEEILIVWLIENNRLVSKERMLEVYFNIVEMGPNVYGIGEAAQYYFGKHPYDLTLGEGLFLSNIMPKPKAAFYKFKSDGSLKDYLFPHFKYIGNIMVRRGLATPDSTGYGFYNVRLKNSLLHLLPKETKTVDTTLIDDGEDFMPLNEIPLDSILKPSLKVDSNHIKIKKKML